MAVRLAATWGGGGGVGRSRRLCFVVTMTPRAGVAGDDPFPEPSELSPAVRFWAAISPQYGQRDYRHPRSRGAGSRLRRRAATSTRDDDPRVQARHSGAPWSASSARRSSDPRRFALFQTARPRRRPPFAHSHSARHARGLRAGLTAERLFRTSVGGRSKPSACRSTSRRSRCRVVLSPGPGLAAGAVGLWQLTATWPIAICASMARSTNVAIRPARACAAARSPARAPRAVRSWPLALTAYNHGPTGVAARARSGRLGRPRSDRSPLPWPGLRLRLHATSTPSSWRHGTSFGTRAPTSPTSPGPSSAYKVKRGDTLDASPSATASTIPSLRVANGLRAALFVRGRCCSCGCRRNARSGRRSAERALRGERGESRFGTRRAHDRHDLNRRCAELVRRSDVAPAPPRSARSPRTDRGPTAFLLTTRAFRRWAASRSGRRR